MAQLTQISSSEKLKARSPSWVKTRRLYWIFPYHGTFGRKNSSKGIFSDSNIFFRSCYINFLVRSKNHKKQSPVANDVLSGKERQWQKWSDKMVHNFHNYFYAKGNHHVPTKWWAARPTKAMKETHSLIETVDFAFLDASSVRRFAYIPLPGQSTIPSLSLLRLFSTVYRLFSRGYQRVTSAPFIGLSNL